MIQVRDKNFRVVQQSKNLRGIFVRSRVFNIERIDIWPGKDGGSQIGMCWADGSSAIFDFGDASIAKRFFESRVARLGWPEPKFHVKEKSQ